MRHELYDIVDAIPGKDFWRWCGRFAFCYMWVGLACYAFSGPALVGGIVAFIWFSILVSIVTGK
jgi:hypothetical protein